MELMTKEIKERLLKANDEDVAYNMDAEVIVKYFNPVGNGVWLIVRAEEWDGGLWLYGYITLGLDYGTGIEWEWGPVMLHTLEELQLPLCMSIERDLHCKGKTVKELKR